MDSLGDKDYAALLYLATNLFRLLASRRRAVRQLQRCGDGIRLLSRVPVRFNDLGKPMRQGVVRVGLWAKRRVRFRYGNSQRIPSSAALPLDAIRTCA